MNATAPLLSRWLELADDPEFFSYPPAENEFDVNRETVRAAMRDMFAAVTVLWEGIEEFERDDAAGDLFSDLADEHELLRTCWEHAFRRSLLEVARTATGEERDFMHFAAGLFTAWVS